MGCNWKNITLSHASWFFLLANISTILSYDIIFCNKKLLFVRIIKLCLTVLRYSLLGLVLTPSVAKRCKILEMSICCGSLSHDSVCLLLQFSMLLALDIIAIKNIHLNLSFYTSEFTFLCL